LNAHLKILFLLLSDG